MFFLQDLSGVAERATTASLSEREREREREAWGVRKEGEKRARARLRRDLLESVALSPPVPETMGP